MPNLYKKFLSNDFLIKHSNFPSLWMPERKRQLLCWLQKSWRRSWVPPKSDGMPKGAKNSWKGNLKPQTRKNWEVLSWEAFLLLLLNLFPQVAFWPSWGEGPTPGPSPSWMAHSLHLLLLLLDCQRKVKVWMHRLLPRHHLASTTTTSPSSTTAKPTPTAGSRPLGGFDYYSLAYADSD